MIVLLAKDLGKKSIKNMLKDLKENMNIMRREKEYKKKYLMEFLECLNI